MEKSGGIKASWMFGKNLEWFMAKVDVLTLMQKLGLPIVSKAGDDVISYCPDHHLFVGHRPSHPKWYFNTKTGETFCHTEGRGSNIIYTVKRILSEKDNKDYSPKEAANWILGEECDLDLFQMKGANSRLHKLFEEDVSKNTVKHLHDVEEEIKYGAMLDSGYEYFMRPTNKKPTNITEETIKHFKVFQRTWGYYKDRVIIPVFYKQAVTGFVAVDILGKEKWMKRNPEAEDKDYKKTLYPQGFKSGQHLFGYDEVKVGADRLLLVEGPRDAMKLWQEGYTDSLGMFGVNVTGGHIRLLSELMPKSIFIMLDGDEAGREASKKVARKLDQFTVYIVDTPEGEDPKTLDKRVIKSLLRGAKLFSGES
jgi:5S rRNA maturation endonuclease (ribonuclease M5)